MQLPDGTPFVFWDDETTYEHEWHVATDHPAADDTGPGTADQPFATLAAAASKVAPGERVVVHEGVYRECLQPTGGGDGASRMITWTAAPGERVVLSASEVWAPDFRPTKTDRSGRCWIGALPTAAMAGYNPFAMVNLSRSDWFPWTERPAAERHTMLGRRGMIFQDGQPLQQVSALGEVRQGPGRFWVEDNGERVLLRPFDDLDPNTVTWEVSLRRECCRPSERGLGWLRIAGFEMCHAANGFVPPQYGACSTANGHHWIIEDCRIHHHNAVGIDIGTGGGLSLEQRWYEGGDHIVRRNDIWDCGITGICGTSGVSRSLIEGNRLARIGTHKLEHLYENAAIKFHVAKHLLIRHNRIEDLDGACGIWMDWQCADNRLHGNWIRNLTTLLAGIYIEINQAPNLVDGNIVLDCDDAPDNDPPKDGFPGGLGLSSDVSDFTAFQHNFVARIRGHYAIACHLAQGARHLKTRSSLCCGMEISGNVLVDTPKRVFLARRHDNQCRANVYAKRDQAISFCLLDADREPVYDLTAWQDLLDFDQDSIELALQLRDEGEGLYLTCDQFSDELPAPTLPEYDASGPLSAAQWQTLAAGGRVPLSDLFAGPAQALDPEGYGA